MKPVRIAIDGPSSAGKSTISKAVARHFGISYADTGAIYRTLALHMINKGIPAGDTQAVIAELPNADIYVGQNGGRQFITLGGKDVTSSLRTERISLDASTVSKIPEVRAFLLDVQRRIARSGSVVMDGRDIGTSIMPDADLKIFLTAAPEARARRRWSELTARGEAAEYDDVLRDLTARDAQDASRAASPLKPAEDAVIVDTTGNTLERSIAVIIEHVKKVVE